MLIEQLDLVRINPGGCLSSITYGLPCVCAIALKIKNKIPIRLDEIHTHWKMLRFEYEGDIYEG